MDIVSRFRRAARCHADRLFLCDSESRVTYAEANEVSGSVAADLQARGCSNGQTVAFAVADSVSLWTAIIGTWKIGALPALIDSRIAASELSYHVQDVSADIVVTVAEREQEFLDAGAREVVLLENLGGTCVGQDVGGHGAQSPLYLSYTSGTTGQPKGVILLSEPVTLGTACIGDRLGLSCLDLLLATTPASSSFQLVSALMPAIGAGAAVCLASGLSIDSLWAVADEMAASILVAYPLTLSDMVGTSHGRRSSFRLALSGGSPLAPRLKEDYRRILGIDLLESYGQSEMGGFMAMGRQGQSGASPGSVGPSLPDRLAYVGGEGGAELEPGQVGEVLVEQGYFDHYQNKPRESAQATTGGVLHTGDLGVADELGDLRVLGRIREADNAKRRGVFLREVEDLYYQHPEVRHAVVVESSEAQIEAFVELQRGAGTSANQLTDHVATRIPIRSGLQRTTVLEKMPRTLSGKADRLTLSSRLHIGALPSGRGSEA